MLFVLLRSFVVRLQIQVMCRHAVAALKKHAPIVHTTTDQYFAKLVNLAVNARLAWQASILMPYPVLQ